ncbi:MAG: DMT family transporter [Thermodesulfobacteriota bacterium]
MRGWFFLTCAILLEVAGTTCMKLSQGFTRPVPSALIFVFYGLSFASLTVVLDEIELSVAYTVWSGLGTALIVAVGFAWFKEPLTAVKLASIALIILGVAGLNLSGVRH